MPIKLFKTREEIAETLRESAIETKDGQFAVEEPLTELGDAGKKALQAERDRAAEAERKAAAAAEELAKLKRDKSALEKGVSEEALQKIRADEEAARAPIIAERDRLAAENRKLKLTDRVRALYLEHGGMTDRIDDAMLILDRRTDLGDQDGIVFNDKDGKVTADDPKAFFAKLKAEKKYLFKGTGSSGSGSEGSEGGEESTQKNTDADAQRRSRVLAGF